MAAPSSAPAARSILPTPQLPILGPVHEDRDRPRSLHRLRMLRGGRTACIPHRRGEEGAGRERPCSGRLRPLRGGPPVPHGRSHSLRRGDGPAAFPLSTANLCLCSLATTTCTSAHPAAW